MRGRAEAGGRIDPTRPPGLGKKSYNPTRSYFEGTLRSSWQGCLPSSLLFVFMVGLQATFAKDWDGNPLNAADITWGCPDVERCIWHVRLGFRQPCLIGLDWWFGWRLRLKARIGKNGHLQTTNSSRLKDPEKGVSGLGNIYHKLPVD